MNKLIRIHPDMIVVEDIEQVSPNDRLFFEVGNWVDGVWTGTGMFSEIDDVEYYIKEDKNLKDKEYLKHHNFMVIKNK